ncbi:hypothetical protein Cgig2_032520 [Carnegiea gigantea]|uniref:Protein kinase domain-containing protein n=1 Tax=Carnegiea gigantea TaxID=171969 RepID=A0A9Q1KXJ3_9CARY|nr:hypothetical protein Cgig2_032520 [Carnegiea gigantea]
MMTGYDNGGRSSSSSSKRRRRTSRVSAASSAVHSPDQTVDLSRLFLGPLIGFGGHGRVYRGKYNDQDVALKVIEFESLECSRNFQEVGLLSRLNHPNVLKFIGEFTQNSNRVHCIVTEYLSEGSLRSYLNKQHPNVLPVEKLVTFALDIARGMEYLHSQGIIHRDLKPDNILIEGGSLRMKIVDFGVSCEEGKDGCVIDDGKVGVVGSYRWMAPEMIQGKVYGRKVDVYSFGLLLSELVSGRVPFEGMSPVVAACGVINRNLRPDLPEECPPPMRALIESCWASNHKKRPEFSQIVKVLEGFQSSLARYGTLQFYSAYSLRLNEARISNISSRGPIPPGRAVTAARFELLFLNATSTNSCLPS